MHYILNNIKNEIDELYGLKIDFSTFLNILLCKDLINNYSMTGNVIGKGFSFSLPNVRNFELDYYGDGLYAFSDSDSRYKETYFSISTEEIYKLNNDPDFSIKVHYSENQWIDLQYGINKGTQELQNWTYLVTLTFKPKN